YDCCRRRTSGRCAFVLEEGAVIVTAIGTGSAARLTNNQARCPKTSAGRCVVRRVTVRGLSSRSAGRSNQSYELSSEVVDERERRRTLLGKLSSQTPRPRWQPGERYATYAGAYHCEARSTG